MAVLVGKPITMFEPHGKPITMFEPQGGPIMMQIPWQNPSCCRSHDKPMMTLIPWQIHNDVYPVVNP